MVCRNTEKKGGRSYRERRKRDQAPWWQKAGRGVGVRGGKCYGKFRSEEMLDWMQGP